MVGLGGSGHILESWNAEVRAWISPFGEWRSDPIRWEGPWGHRVGWGKVGKAPESWLGAENGGAGSVRSAGSTGHRTWGTAWHLSTCEPECTCPVTVDEGRCGLQARTVWPVTVTAIMRPAPFMGTLHGPTHLIPTGPSAPVCGAPGMCWVLCLTLGHSSEQKDRNPCP